jgi:hypothetical protein
MNQAEKEGLKFRTISNLNAKPSPVTGQFMHQLGHGNHIYLIGAGSPTRNFCRFDLTTRLYESLPIVPYTAVSSASAVILNDTLYYGTGLTDGNGTAQSFFHAYDIPTGTWLTRATPGATSRSSFAALNGKVYLVGGNETRRLFREYDPTTNVWTTKAALPADIYGGMAVGYEGKLYALAGNGVLYSWDPETNTWTTGVTLFNSYYNLGLGFANGKLFWPVARDLYCAEDITQPVFIKQPAGEPTNMVLYALAHLNNRIYSVLSNGSVTEFYE